MSKMNTDYLIKLTSDKSRSMSGKGIENILEYADINKLKEKIQQQTAKKLAELAQKEAQAKEENENKEHKEENEA